MKKEYIIPITLIACALILGVSFFIVQVNKQTSIEKQQQIKIEREKEIEETQKAEKELNEMLYDWCVDEADGKYWAYMKLNGQERADGAINAEMRFWNTAEENKKEDISNCVIRYLK